MSLVDAQILTITQTEARIVELQNSRNNVLSEIDILESRIDELRAIETTYDEKIVAEVDLLGKQREILTILQSQ